MDRLEAMSILTTVVEVGSLSAAGRRLNTPLATVSRKISDLEAHLKTRLLNRTSRRVSLTDAGRDYVAACKRILDDVREAERAASGEYSAPRGDLTLSAPIVFGRMHVLPVVTEFLVAYPDIDVRLDLSDAIANLIEDKIDVALRIGALPDSSLVATNVGSIRRVVCASPDYFKRRGAPKKPEDLARHDCITFEGIAAPDSWRFLYGNKDIAVAVRSRLTVSAAEAAVDAAVAGVGVARLYCYQVAQARREKKLVTALEAFEPSPAPIGLVYAGDRMLPQKLRAFLDFAAPRLRARMAEAWK